MAKFYFDIPVSSPLNYVENSFHRIGRILVAILAAMVFTYCFTFTNTSAIESISPVLVESDTGTEQKDENNWIQVNHDVYGTRNSNQTVITKNNVDKLQVKWRLFNDFEIQEPPIVIGHKGYVQDYVGNIIAFDTLTGKIIWKIHIGNGPTMGLVFNHGIIFSSTASNSSIVAINATNGEIKWVSKVLGNPLLGYSVDSPPIVWKNYVIAGSGGSGLPPGLGMVKGNVTAINSINGEIIWNLDTTAGDWVKLGKTPPNGGATAWSGGSLDPETGKIYIPLGSASPNFNASTRQTPNFYSNHMMAINVTNGKILWATPFIAHGTVLDVRVPDTHDWDTSWGSSISRVILDNKTQEKLVVGHDKMGNVIAMNAVTGKEIWWKSLGKRYNTDSMPSSVGSGMIWSYGVYSYHAVDSDSLYIAATNRGLNFFTDGKADTRSPLLTIEQGLRNGTIFALDLATGNIKWQYATKFPPRVSPLITNSIVFCGYIPFTEKVKSGVILALDKQTGEKLWEFNVNAPIGPVGPSIGDGLLYVPTGKVQGLTTQGQIGGSIVAFGLP